MPELAAHLERVAKEWYATFKERDPHHCEGYEEMGDDCFVMHQPYTFESFRNSPLVLAGLDAVAAALAACAREEAKWWSDMCGHAEFCSNNDKDCRACARLRALTEESNGQHV